jgi:serine phosphatase RsbU (regulator of sigma subunit)
VVVELATQTDARAIADDLTLPSAATLPARAPGNSLRDRIERLLRPDTGFGRVFDTLILMLIVISVASVIVEAAPGLPPWARQALHIEELVIVAVFSFEYLLRLAAAERKLAFIFSFQGVVDLLSIAPFYLLGVDARWLRMLRLLRLIRVLKLQTHHLENIVATRTRELADKNAALESAQAQLKAELDIAKALQIAILPAAFPTRPGCDAAARMIPATSMGGDFYDFIELPDGRIGLVMADVAGKGVPAAFFMAVAWTHLRDLALQYAEPGACLAQTNEVLCTQNPMELFVTVFYCVFDPTTGALHYANGGHNAPYLRRADGSIETLDGTVGLILGVMPGIEYPQHTLQLQPGDRLVLYTDGVTEAFSVGQEAFGTGRLIDEVQAHGDGPAAALVERICRSVSGFAAQAPQSDDITLTVLVWDQRPPALPH